MGACTRMHLKGLKGVPCLCCWPVVVLPKHSQHSKTCKPQQTHCRVSGLQNLGAALTPLPMPRKDSQLVTSGVYGEVLHRYIAIVCWCVQLCACRLSRRMKYNGCAVSDSRAKNGGKDGGLSREPGVTLKRLAPYSLPPPFLHAVRQPDFALTPYCCCTHTPNIHARTGYMRHPMYGGLLAASLGLAAVTHDEARLLAAAVLWAVLEQKVGAVALCEPAWACVCDTARPSTHTPARCTPLRHAFAAGCL